MKQLNFNFESQIERKQKIPQNLLVVHFRSRKAFPIWQKLTRFCLKKVYPICVKRKNLSFKKDNADGNFFYPSHATIS